MQRDLPSALTGGPRNSEASDRRLAHTRLLARLTAGVATLALGLTLAVPAWADELDDERDRIAQDLTSAQAKVDNDVKTLANASSALAQSQGRLVAAKKQLAETQRLLAVAEQKDREAASRWATAQDDLEAAKAAVVEGERNVAAQQSEVGSVARTQYQQRSGMVGIGMVVTGSSTGDINNRIQWSTTVFDSTQAEMDKLRELQRQLVAAQDRQARIEQQLAAERADAAANLVTRQQLTLAASEQQASVAALVQTNASLEAAAEQQLEASESQAKALAGEQRDVESRIADRMARQQAEDARRMEADRQAREDAMTARSRAEIDAARAKAEADAAAERARGAEQKAPSNSVPARQAAPAPAPAAAESSSPFILPVQGRLTSRYGMRLHPVLKVWKLHDGTDYAASCGTPMRAAADGVVAERYYNAGYGNRLMIDHGRVNGQFVTTGYNHATRYTVSVGQRVKKGDVVGYVGSTGYSTGCHLHLMTWVNGKVVNPQTLF